MTFIYILLICAVIYWIVFKVIIPPIAQEKLIQLLSKNVEIIDVQIKRRVSGDAETSFSETYTRLLHEFNLKDIWIRILARKPSPYDGNSERKEFSKLAMQLKDVLVYVADFMGRDMTLTPLLKMGSSSAFEARDEMQREIEITMSQKIADIKKTLGEN